MIMYGIVRNFDALKFRGRASKSISLNTFCGLTANQKHSQATPLADNSNKRTIFV